MDTNKKVVELDVNDVLPNRFQPRIKFNEDSINELSESIKEHGVIQPIIVRPMGDRYEIIAGERRYKASLLAGKQTIPAIVIDLNDKDSAEIALIENVQRKDLTPIEEAISYKKILDMGYLTQEELAVKLGKNQSTVANKLRLLNLADEVQEAVLDEKISERHARSLLKLKDQNKQIELLNKIINERLTVRKTDEEISKMLSNNNNDDIDLPVIIEEEKGANKMNNNFDPFAQLNGGTNETSSFGLDFNNPNTLFSGEQNVPTPTASVDTTPDILPTQPKFINVDVPDVQENTVSNLGNPGFMDVANIQNNAQNINVERPMANLDSLLAAQEMPSPEPVSPMPAAVPTSTSVGDTSVFNFDFQPAPVQKVNSTMEMPGFVQQPVINPTPEVDVNNNFDFNQFGMQANINDIQSTPAPVMQNIEQEQRIEPLVSAPIDRMPMSSEDMPIPSFDVAPETRLNINRAIQSIRENLMELERLGYSLTSDEIDLDSYYQLTIKIQK